MTWANRLRLLVGLIVVAAVALGATLVLSQRETQVASRTASIKALTYTVGSDYAGTVISAKVAEGDTVTKGEPLLTIQSATALADLKSKQGVSKSLGYRVSSTGVVTLLATQPGVVSRLSTDVGSFVGAGVPVATIDRANSLYVLADFKLDPYDFSRIAKGATVDLVLPNQQLLEGTVTDISSVTTTAGRADATIKVKSSALVRGRDNGLVVPGTPINATLHLRDDGPLAGIKLSMVTLLRQIGL
ncbi:HlyD family efflux transporter periplasmic adaptor subunit [Galbitalea soli]|uniref:HlyD family efflux transporter periplasmic adaptor subunit n=1 Tax=Galbitalea soli TaxID=1268042 RepID=A0A7C9TTN9_9MICO|nr:HlyD family efflux transporter periplasmic adaptor subunit [Galbitalea soli]NEM92083.1 HlyD family efflux transporter periplasmic adaptor subunit [Galbitalea soli]NYJ31965.1 multidrug resistance efflux pump [Galbitalea soli]